MARIAIAFASLVPMLLVLNVMLPPPPPGATDHGLVWIGIGILQACAFFFFLSLSQTTFLKFGYCVMNL